MPNNTDDGKKTNHQPRQQNQLTEPQYKPNLDFLNNDAQRDSFPEIARCVVLGELESDFRMNTIGRLDVKYEGNSVYTRVTRSTNSNMIADSQFLKIAEKAKKAFLKDYAGNLDKLAPVGEAEKGKSQPVNLDLVFPYVKPVFHFICGESRRMADCSMPQPVVALLRKIDHELTEKLLSRRADQVRLKQLLSTTPSQAHIDKYCKKHGWSKNYFEKLKAEGIFSSKDIANCRRNLFAGILFNRCVSPFLLYSAEELKRDSNERQAGARPELLKLAEATNKIFKNDYKEFVTDFINESDKYLDGAVAEKLVTITRSEARISGLKSSKKARSQAPNRGSAPTLPQGAAFRRAMAEEGEHAAREGVASRSTSTEDYKTQRDAAIDVFKSKHSSDFGNREFALEFNRQLKTWKRDAGEVKIKDVERQMRRIHRQVKDEMAKWEDEEPSGQPGLSSSASILNMPEENSRATKLVKTPEKEGSKAKQPVQKQAAIIRLNKGKADTLDSFASNDKYKTEFQRYPELRQKMEAQAVAWISRDTGGSFVLALQKIYEEQVIACFFQSQADANSAHGVSAEQLQTAVNGWKKQADDFGKLVNLGKPVYSQDLQKIWDSLKHKQSPMQLANVAVEKFMQRPEVQGECRNDRAMQTDFNRRIESWLANGGHSTDPEVAVREIYHTTLIEHFQKERVLGNAGGESLIAVSILVFEAANKWSNTNPGQVLTTPILAGFLNTSVSPRQ